jgi:hypothetical protein
MWLSLAVFDRRMPLGNGAYKLVVAGGGCSR